MATSNGNVLAKIVARDASIHCIPTKIRPRYSAFWHIPTIVIARHWAQVAAKDWRSKYAIETAMLPAIRNLSAEIVRGGACCTIMRAEVNALPHIKEKATPIRISTQLIFCLMFLK